MRGAGKAILWSAAGIAAFAIGAGAAWYMTGSAGNAHGSGPAPWRTSAAIGDTSATPYTRAIVARTGLWALPRSEVIYYLTEHDDQGRALDVRCTYELRSRGELPARWWSIAAYVGYHFVASPQDRYSYTRTNVARDASGGYTIRVSRAPQPGNWLPLGTRTGSVQLLTRLYEPDPARTADPLAVPLASVKRVACA